MINAPKEEVVSRLKECLKCEEYLSLTHQCKKCLCFLPLKARLKGQSCPLGKW